MPTEKRDEHGRRSFSLWITDALRETVRKRAAKVERSLGQQMKYYIAMGMAWEDKEDAPRRYPRKKKAKSKR